MPWQQLILHTSAQKADGLSDLLSVQGALAVSMSDAADQPLFEPPVGATPLWQQTVVVGLFDPEWPIKAVIEAIEEYYRPAPAPRHQLLKLEDQDWERVCLDQFHPMQYGDRLWICPSWLSPPQPDAVNVFLDPGLAFGTGTHPTTSLCLEWLDANFQQNWSVIDFGCGSGILAIAALKLGAKHVYAIDIDPQAILATETNAEKNAVIDCLTAYQADKIPEIQVDLLLANILSGPLLELAEKLAKMVRTDGYIVLSGILQDQARGVIDRYSSWFDLSPTTFHDGWVRIDGKRREDS